MHEVMTSHRKNLYHVLLKSNVFGIGTSQPNSAKQSIVHTITVVTLKTNCGNFYYCLGVGYG